MAISNNRKFRRVASGMILYVAVSLVAPESHAAIYAYTDAQGRIRVTDIPERGGRDIVVHQPKTSENRAPSAPSTSAPPTSYPAPYTGRDKSPEAFRPFVAEAARRYNLSEALIFAVIRAESGFNSRAVSHAGAQGLMQLIPATARLVGVVNSFDARDNILGGAKYLRMMLDRFGRIDHALAAYNAGPEAVERHGGIPPYKETMNYVPKVLRFYREFGGSGELRLASAATASTSNRKSGGKTAKSPSALASSVAEPGNLPKKTSTSSPLFYYRGPDGQIYISNTRE